MKYWSCLTCGIKLSIPYGMILTDHEVLNAHQRYVNSLSDKQRCAYPTVVPLIWREENNTEDNPALQS